jgi:8-oxo-dGTP diphosphatase
MSRMAEIPHVRVVVAEIEEDGAFLLTQRRANAIFPHLWEFPGGRVEEGEADADALRRTLLDRLGVHAEIVGPSAASAHDYDTYVVELAVLRVRLHERPRALKVQDFAWVRPEAFDRYEFPPADRGTVSRLLGLDSGVAEGD